MYLIPEPLHPAVVHLPIALWLVGSLFIVLSLWKPYFFDRAAMWMLVIGTIGGVISYQSGPNAVGVAFQLYGDSVGEFLGLHQQFAFYSLITYIFTVILLAVNIVLDNKYLRWLLILLAIAGAVFVFLTGHYAGRMMYDGV
ncbi:hypothetical protein FLK61_31750 [Paenalkalicoccus suaedae]|uniref:DUF2231 domain-containing protein n=1 Tax=Paenalkalicoccus suaedae TaxID=2592382 RepID=A0A859FGF7_9BACI|nr:DUF2231 domain-containing protein [Paenalkalicoccus suaedae]QKS71285.1 hypothetical protein FLK61_31750 [Paenalkalicoccus suaedae]